MAKNCTDFIPTVPVREIRVSVAGEPYFATVKMKKQLCGGERNTTNNRMELMAAIAALEALKQPCDVILTTDSQYVRKGITEWLKGWKRNGWKTAAKQPVKNADLWQRLDALNARYKIDWRWVKGHSGTSRQ